MLPLPT